MNQQLIDHISRSGPIKIALKNVKSIWTKPEVSDGSVLTLDFKRDEAWSLFGPQFSSMWPTAVRHKSLVVKNNGYIFTPSSPLKPASHVFGYKLDKVTVLVRDKIQKTMFQSESPVRACASFLLWVFLKEAPFHSDCEQLTGGVGVWDSVAGIFRHMEGGPIVCTEPSLQGLVVPLSGNELWWGATSPSPSLNRCQLPFITALLLHHTVPSAPSQHPWFPSRSLDLHEISFGNLKKV